MAITVTVTPGKQFGSTEAVDIDGLNALGQPTFAITGTIGTSDVSDGGITAQKSTVDIFDFGTAVFDSGTYDLTYSGTQQTSPASYLNGMVIAFKADANCTGATDIQIGALGDKNLFKNQTEELQKGDIVTGQIVHARYDGTSFQMTSQSSLPDSWRVTTTGTAPNFLATLTPPGLTVTTNVTLAELEGRPIHLKLHEAGVGADDLNITVGGGSALGATAITKNGSTALVAGDVIANQEITVVYSAATTSFQMVSPTAVSARDYVLLRDEKTSGTDAGTSSPSVTWNTRVLNTEIDPSSLATLSANQVTLTAGTYRFRGYAPAVSALAHKLRLENVTDATTIAVGSSSYAIGGGHQSHAFIEGRFTIAAGKALELQHYVSTGVETTGHGVATSAGVAEVYAVLEFFRET